jgi:hypothetical protein
VPFVVPTCRDEVGLNLNYKNLKLPQNQLREFLVEKNYA